MHPGSGAPVGGKGGERRATSGLRAALDQWPPEWAPWVPRRVWKAVEHLRQQQNLTSSAKVCFGVCSPKTTKSGRQRAFIMINKCLLGRVHTEESGDHGSQGTSNASHPPPGRAGTHVKGGRDAGVCGAAQAGWSPGGSDRPHAPRSAGTSSHVPPWSSPFQSHLPFISASLIPFRKYLIMCSYFICLTYHLFRPRTVRPPGAGAGRLRHWTLPSTQDGACTGSALPPGPRAVAACESTS